MFLAKDGRGVEEQKIVPLRLLKTFSILLILLLYYDLPI